MERSMSHFAYLINDSWACWAPEGNKSIIEFYGINWINVTMIDTLQCNFLYFKQTR